MIKPTIDIAQPNIAGNIYMVITAAKHALKAFGHPETLIAEMQSRAIKQRTYDQAVRIVGKYVNFKVGEIA